MNFDIENFASVFILATFLVVAITALIRGPRVFDFRQWPRLFSVSFIVVLCINALFSFARIAGVIENASIPVVWGGILIYIAWWPGIVDVWRKRLPTDLPLFHVPPVGTPAPGQQRRIEEKP